MLVKAKALIPFVPAGPNFDVSLDFFTKLGFEIAWRNEGLAGLRSGGAYFLLQDINVREWQENQMLIIEVDDLDVYWREIDSLGLMQSFPGVRLRAPEQFPWGREVHIIDPAGVCWHVRQSKAA